MTSHSVKHQILSALLQKIPYPSACLPSTPEILDKHRIWFPECCPFSTQQQTDIRTLPRGLSHPGVITTHRQKPGPPFRRNSKLGSRHLTLLVQRPKTRALSALIPLPRTIAFFLSSFKKYLFIHLLIYL